MLHIIVYCGYNFSIFSITGGFWGDWLNWSVCSTNCGGGTQKRQRTCDNPPPYLDGSYCSGLSLESRSCNNMCCPSMCFLSYTYMYALCFTIKTKTYVLGLIISSVFPVHEVK